MADSKTSRSLEGERIDVQHDYSVCAWARHFNTSEKQVKDAVKAVGARAVHVRDHLLRQSGSDHPCAM